MANYNLDDTQARYFTTHKEGVIIVPLPEQPPKGWKVLHDYGSEIIFYMPNKPIYIISFKLPYPEGSLVNLRETWKRCIINKKGYEYKNNSSCTGCKYLNCSYMFEWHSPATMPNEAVRYPMIVSDPKVVRVQKVNVGEALQMGYEPDMELGYGTVGDWIRNWFNTRYNNPRLKQRFSWDDDPWCEIFKVKEVER